MVSNKQTIDELDMSIFLSRCNHSVNVLIVALIMHKRKVEIYFVVLK